MEDNARPLPMTIAAGPSCPHTKWAANPTTTAVVKTYMKDDLDIGPGRVC